MQTLVFAAVLAAAAAATIPNQEPLFTDVKLPVFEFFHQENVSTLYPAEQVDYQLTTISQPDNAKQVDHQSTTTSKPDSAKQVEHQSTTTSKPDNAQQVNHQSTTTSKPHKEQLTLANPQSPPLQPDVTVVNHEKLLNQSPQQAHNQPETLAVDAVHTLQAAEENSSYYTMESKSSHAVQERPKAEQAQIVKEETVTPSEAPQSDITQASTPSPNGGSETTSASSLEPLNLPSGASFMLGAISTTFSCLDRPYGYYADLDNNCHVFHVCNPSFFPDGSVHTYQYSFMCGEGTLFDQKEMTCVAEWAATSCTESTSFYLRNQEFGQVLDTHP